MRDAAVKKEDITRAMKIIRAYKTNTIWTLSQSAPLALAEAITSAGYRVRWAATIPKEDEMKKEIVWLCALLFLSGCASVKKFHKAIIPQEPPVLILPTGFPGISWIYDVRRKP